MWDKLTPAQRAELAARGKKECEASYKSTYNNFKNTSSGVFTASNYERGRGFYHEYKVDKDVKRKIDIRIWKQDVNNRVIYFYVTETNLGTNSYFLKITQAENEAMIDDLYSDHCDKTALKVTTGSSGPAKAVQEYNEPNSPNTDEYTDTFTYNFNYLAYFANFNLARDVKTVTTSGSTVGSVVKYTSSLVAKNYTFEEASYTAKRDNNFVYSQKFCTIKENIDGNKYRVAKEPNTFGYVLKENSIDATKLCETTKPADWNL